MSQAERLSKQQERARLEVEDFERKRTALAPKRMAVYVGSCFRFFPWREVHFSRIAYDGALGIQRRTFHSTRSNA